MLLKSLGWRVIVMTLTRGELGGDPEQRVMEEVESIRQLSLEVWQGEMPDGNLQLNSCINAISEQIQSVRPDVIFTHAMEDTHQDHAVLTRAALVAARKVACVLFYEGPSTQKLEPTVKIDISTVWQAKVAAIEAHVSQNKRLNLIGWASGLARYRAWPNETTRLVEAFQVHRMFLSLQERSNLSASETLVDAIGSYSDR